MYKTADNPRYTYMHPISFLLFSLIYYYFLNLSQQGNLCITYVFLKNTKNVSNLTAG